MRRVSVALALLLLVVLVPIAHAQDQRCFPETSQCISGPIRTYWERNGGLPVFGFPIIAQAVEYVEGVPLQAQWFERDRLEIQPNGLVTAGRLGVERLEQLGTPWTQGVITGSVPGCLDFPQTGYQVCLPAFAQYWRANGGLERFGYPVTDEFETTVEGQTYIVQYFERRRFELHPEIGPNAVLLGLLGREVYDARQAAPALAPAQAPAPPTAITAPAPTATPGRTGNCDAAYPDVCIPPPPPDLDCGDITYRDFRVLPPDPHRFDRDHDGIGCES
jgi:hypothetical protein